MRLKVFLEGHNGAERTPLFDKNDVSLALYEVRFYHSNNKLMMLPLQEEYNTQGQKIGQMLRSLSLYTSVLPNSDDAESTTASRNNQPQARIFF